MPPPINLGNVVGLLRSPSEISKRYVIWAKQIDNLVPDKTIPMYYDYALARWNHFNASKTFFLPPVKDFDLNTPPSSPALGDTYLIGSTPTGVWTGKAYNHATWMGNVWDFIIPLQGARTGDLTLVTTSYYFDGSVWAAYDFTFDLGAGTNGQVIQYQSGSWTKTITFKDVSNITCINLDTRRLYHGNGNISYDWNTYAQFDSNQVLSHDHSGRHLWDSGGKKSIDYELHLQYDTDQVLSWAYSSRLGYDNSSVLSFNWQDGIGYDASGFGSLFYRSRLLKDSSNHIVFDWQNKKAYGSSSLSSLWWDARLLFDSTGSDIVSWASNTAGLVYSNDYSLGYGDRSIPDVGFVRSLAAFRTFKVVAFTDSPYQILPGDPDILVDTSGGPVTVILPLPGAFTRRNYFPIKKITLDINAVSVTQANLIDGIDPYPFTTPNKALVPTYDTINATWYNF